MRTFYGFRDARSVSLFLLSLGLHGLSSAIYALWLNLHVLELGYSRAMLGLLNAIPSAIALGLALPAGWWIDRIGRRPVMIMGGLMMALGTIGVGIGRSPTTVGIGVGLIGAGYILFSTAYVPLIMGIATGGERVQLFALASAVLFWAEFLGEGIGGALPHLLRNWPIGPTLYARPILLTALLDLLAVLPLLGIREPDRRPSHRRADPPVPASVRNRIARMAFPNLLMGIGAALSIPFLNVYFHERYRLPDEILGLLFAATSAGTGLATLAAPALAQWIGRIRTIVLTQTLSIGFLVVMALTDQAAWAALAMMLRGALMNMASPLYTEFCMAHIPPSRQGTASAILNMAWEAGWMIGAALSGFLQQTYGLAPMLLATAALYGVGTLYQALAFAHWERVILPLPGSSYSPAPRISHQGGKSREAGEAVRL